MAVELPEMEKKADALLPHLLPAVPTACFTVSELEIT